jgi:hypothetical protein
MRSEQLLTHSIKWQLQAENIYNTKLDFVETHSLLFQQFQVK